MNASGVGNFLGDERVEAAAPALGAVRAKMLCNGIETLRSSWSRDKEFVQHKVRLGAVCGDSADDKAYSDATPSGECWLNISDGRPAIDFFKPGKRYYVTFTEAPD